MATSSQETSDAPPKRRGYLARILLATAVLLVILLGAAVWRATSTPSIHVSPDTTYFTEPLDDQGRVDYAAALNAYHGTGVTRDNNAMAILADVLFIDARQPEDEARYREALGLPATPPPNAPVLGDFFVFTINRLTADQRETLLVRFLESASADQADPSVVTFEDATCAVYDAVLNGPWTEKEHPEVAAWLAANAAALERITVASRRDRLFSPLVGRDHWLLMELLPYLQRMREAGRALLIRANLRFGEGDLQGAMDDVITTLRLARLARQGWSTIQVVVGIAIDAQATERAIHFIAESKQASSWYHEQLELLETLPPRPPISEVLIGERCTSLDLISRLATGQLHEFENEFEWASLIVGLVNWNRVLRGINQWHDRLATAALEPTAPARAGAVRAVADDARSRKFNGNVGIFVTRSWSDVIADTTLGLSMPAMGGFIEADTQSLANEAFLRVALALAAYRADRGVYPESLDRLAPDYLPEVPVDPIRDAPFDYVRTTNGYRLTSTGIDGVAKAAGTPLSIQFGNTPGEDGDAAGENDDVGLIVEHPHDKAPEP